MDTDRTTTYFHTVDNHIVCIGTNGSRIGIQQRNILVFRVSERMVHSLEAVLLVAPLVHREVNDPEEAELVRIDEAALLAHLEAELAERRVDDEALVGDDEQQVARLGARCLGNLGERLILVELLERALDAVFRVLDPGKAFRTVDLDELDEVIEAAARDVRITIDLDALDHAAILNDGVEDLEARALDVLGDVHERHVEAEVRLIGTVLVHGRIPLHALERRLNLSTNGLLEELLSQGFHERQDVILIHEGHLDNHLRICVEEGLDPVTAIRMATLNAAECFDLKDRGAIAPGYRGDVVLLDDLKDFHVNRVFVEGALVAEEGKYLPEIKKCDISSVKGSVIVKDFSKEKFKMNLKSNKVNVIKILPGGVVTAKDTAEIELDANGEFVRNPKVDLVKVAVVERHQGTGNVACGFLKGYGIKEGAVALSVAHDSHNIIVVGVNDEEMEFAVNSLIEQEGGIVLVKEGKVIESMPMPIAGLMSDQSGEWVDQKLTDIHEKAYEELGICGDVEPVMTLCFMSLAVIPEIKLTDMGLFDVTTFSFIPVEVE